MYVCNVNVNDDDDDGDCGDVGGAFSIICYLGPNISQIIRSWLKISANHYFPYLLINQSWSISSESLSVYMHVYVYVYVYTHKYAFIYHI